MKRRWRGSSAGGQRGFALVAVLLVLGFVAVIGAEFAYSMRLEASAARVYKDTLIATHLAEAAVEQAIRELVVEFAFVGVGNDKDANPEVDCPLTFYSRERLAIKRLPHRDVALGGGQFTYCISDEEARLNLNGTTAERIGKLLEVIGLERQDRDVVVDSIQDWRDPNEDHRVNGAESEDTYLKRPIPYRSKNANLDSVNELIQIKGVTTQLLEGVEGRPGLADLVTTKPTSGVNINTARREVLRALGLGDAELTEIEQQRRLGPYGQGHRFGGRGLTVTSRTFRIEAQGIVEGQVRARITAIVQKRTDSGGETVAILEWSGLR